MWVTWVVVVLDVVAKLDAPTARTNTAHATAVPITATLVSFRFRIMIVPNLLDSTAAIGYFSGPFGWFDG
jgi:hypothetical protein